MKKPYENKILLVVLFVLGVIAYNVNLEYVPGLTVSLGMLVMVIILRVFPIAQSVIALVGILLLSVAIGGFYVTDLLVVLELGYLMWGMKRKKQVQWVTMDMIYWVTCGGFLTYLVLIYSSIAFSNQYALWVTCMRGMNSIFCVFVSDLLLINTPWRWFRQETRNKYYWKLRYFLFHVLLSIITVVFILTLHTTATSQIRTSVEALTQTGNRIGEALAKKIIQWDQSKQQRLLLLGITEANELEQLMKTLGLKNINYILTTSEDIVILSNDPKAIPREKLVEEEWVEKQKVGEYVYSMGPKDEMLYCKCGIRQRYLLYSQTDGHLGLKLYIKGPPFHTQSMLVRECNKLLALFASIIILVILACHIVNKLIFNPLESLASITTDLPETIRLDWEVSWPKCHVYEMDMLIANFRGTAGKLQERFQQIQELVYYDTLTKLGNRHSFKGHMECIKRKGAQVGVMFIDLDQFKQVNDTLGHDTGDELLELTAARLKSMMNDRIQVFRLGGDEFVVTVESTHMDEIYAVGNRIFKLFEQPFWLRGKEVTVGCSLGLSVYPLDSADTRTIMQYADLAMYECKKNGGGYVQRFEGDISRRFEERTLIAQEMRYALQNGDFEMYYQPKIHSQTGEITSMEALIRWPHKEKGFISPGMFIPIAEETGFIKEIDEWTLLQVCRQNKAWQDAGVISVPISINIAPTHFSQPNFLALVRRVIKQVGIEPRYIIIEITEGSALDNVGGVIQTINRLSEMGVGVSIDDFGRGYSSMNQLLMLPVSEIKIDRDFVKDIPTNPKKQVVVRNMVTLAHDLGLNVVAEGIETREELYYLNEIKCDEIQGYLMSRPMKPSAVGKFVKRRKKY